MAYRYLLMFYVHTLLVSIQLRSQYHKKNQVPWCWNHIFSWLSSIWSVKFHCFFSVYIPNSKYFDIIFYLIIGKSTCLFLVGYSQPRIPFEQTMSCHILYVVKMAYRYLLMFYVHTLLVSIQLRSQYHKKNQVPWCWNHIFSWLSSIWSVKFHCFFSVYIPSSKYFDIIFYLIGKKYMFSLVDCSNRGFPLNKPCLAIFYMWLKWHIDIC